VHHTTSLGGHPQLAHLNLQQQGPQGSRAYKEPRVSTPPPLTTRTLVVLALATAAGVIAYKSPAWGLGIATATIVYAFLSAHMQ
jgi:hypothetical protein